MGSQLLNKYSSELIGQDDVQSLLDNLSKTSPQLVSLTVPKILTLNILTFSALKKGTIKVFGGKQIRPMIHIDDITGIYLYILFNKVKSGIYNASNTNISIYKLAMLIKKVIGKNIEIKIQRSKDPRSYRLNSDKIVKAGYDFKKNIIDGINDIKYFYEKGLIKNDEKNYSISWIKKYDEK